MAKLNWGSATHEGNVRPQNEDNAFADGRLFVVADGMGGHLAGEVASEMVVTRLHDALSDASSGKSTKKSAKSSGKKRRKAGHGRDDLVAAVAAANGEIYNESSSNASRAGMGTTVTAMAVVDADEDDGPVGEDEPSEIFAIANVGDSRIYRVRHDRMRQITIDHSFVQELVAEGAITRDEARTHPRRNIVTRALGIESRVRIDSWTLPIVRGDRYVLCSDGLVDEVPDDEIEEILTTSPDPQDAADRCVEAAIENGGRDNVTVVVVDVLEGLDPPAPTQEIDVLPAWEDEATTGASPNQTPAPTESDEAETVEQPAVANTAADAAAAAPQARSGATPPAGTPRTASRAAMAAAAAQRPPQRRATASRFMLIVGVAAVVVLGVVVLTAWARSGYQIAFNTADRVALYQGKEFLWFQPTEVGPYTERRDELTPTAVSLVEQKPTFGSRASADSWAEEYLQTTTTTTTTSTTSTTVAPATTTAPPPATTAAPTTAAPPPATTAAPQPATSAPVTTTGP